ncbi:hypothetical protein LINGRAHAP2_LOCUS18687 [Linum grandiflorum]
MDVKSPEAEYKAFLEKVDRTVYIDNLSPQANESVIKTGLDQFGNVKSVSFIANYMDPRNSMRCALVEMEARDQARNVISMLNESPFMMAGMPRPVRALKAEAEMFDDRPSKPGRKILFRWVDPKDMDFKVVQEMKRAVLRHAAEDSFLYKTQLEEEEKLHKQQLETLKANYKKYEMTAGVTSDGVAHKVVEIYGMRVADDQDGGPL